MNNDAIWLKLSKPPADALKKITGGRLSGKTDINPQWRMEIMTHTFGPVGIGWGYTIDKLWTEPASGGEVFAFAMVSVWYADAGNRSDMIPGIGGSMLINGEKNGLYNSDEAYKMAVTDALSVAFKALGVASEIYRGKFDGSKYADEKPVEVSWDAAKKPTEWKKKPPSENRKTIEERKADALRFLGDNIKHLVLGQEELFTKKINDATDNATMSAIAVEIKSAIDKQAKEAVF